MYCNNCGKQYDDNYLFCPSCGTKNYLKAEQSARGENRQPPAEAPTAYQSPRNAPAQPVYGNAQNVAPPTYGNAWNYTAPPAYGAPRSAAPAPYTSVPNGTVPIPTAYEMPTYAAPPIFRGPVNGAPGPVPYANAPVSPAAAPQPTMNSAPGAGQRPLAKGATEIMFCIKCGARRADRYSFCPVCGAAYASQTAKAPTAEEKPKAEEEAPVEKDSAIPKEKATHNSAVPSPADGGDEITQILSKLDDVGVEDSRAELPSEPVQDDPGDSVTRILTGSELAVPEEKPAEKEPEPEQSTPEKAPEQTVPETTPEKASSQREPEADGSEKTRMISKAESDNSGESKASEEEIKTKQKDSSDEKDDDDTSSESFDFMNMFSEDSEIKGEKASAAAPIAAAAFRESARCSRPPQSSSYRENKGNDRADDAPAPFKESARYSRPPQSSSYRENKINDRADDAPAPFKESARYSRPSDPTMTYRDTGSYSRRNKMSAPVRDDRRYGRKPEEPPRYNDNAPRDRGRTEAQPYSSRGRQASQYSRPASKKGTAQKPPIGIRVASVILSIIMFLFGICAITIASIRVGLNEENMRAICQTGTIADLTVKTDTGEVMLVDLIADSAVDINTNENVQLDSSAIKSFFEKQSTNKFIEDLAAEYSEYFLNGVTPTKLNPDAVGSLLEDMRNDIKADTGFSISDQFITDVKSRLKDGDLSFIYIGADGGGFQTHYGFSPKLISTFLSMEAMIICIVAAVLCMILLFVLNFKNISNGFRENGSNFIAIGIFNLLLAVCSFIISTVSKIYIFTGILKYLAISMGAISLAVLVTGILMLVISRIIRKN